LADQFVGESALTPLGMASTQLAQGGFDRGRHLVRAMPGPMRAVGQGVQAAAGIAAQPAVDGLAAHSIAVGYLDHREPVAQHFHDGVEALLCHCELQEHAPDLLASPLVGEAQEGRAVVSTINWNSGTHQPASTGQASTGSAHATAQGRARNLPETTPHAASPRPTAQPSAAPLTCAAVWGREVPRGIVNSPRIDGKDGVAASVSGRLKRANCGWWPCGRGLEWLFVRPSSLWRLSVAPRHYELVCTRSSYDAFLDLPSSPVGKGRRH
jgi:hypothetical protein